LQKADFVHLHNHTDYSLLDGACQIEKLVALAKKHKMPALAITDHGNLFGAIQFYQAASKAGIKPIIGCEFYVARGKCTERPKGKKSGEVADHLVVLAADRKGYANLMELSTSGYLDGFYYHPRIDKELLQTHSEGLIGLSACLKGEIPRLIDSGDLDRAAAVAGEYSEVFGKGNFYLEVQNHGIKQQEAVNRGLQEISKRCSLPLVLTNDTHYLEHEDSEAHDVLLCIQTGKTVEDTDRMRFGTDQVYFKSPEEMARVLPEIPEAYGNTIEVAEKCNLSLEFGSFHLPEFPLPEGFDSAEQYLRHLAREGLTRRYETVTEGVASRFEYELDVICNMGFAGYFLVVRDFVHAARQRGIPVGPGRGSAAGSLVSYCLGITDLDPLEHGLLFERFLNPERVSLPDIDIDFCFERRGEVIEYVSGKYGAESVAQIITFGTMAARAAVRDVGRALRFPYSEVDRIAKMIPYEPGMTLPKALSGNPALRRMAAESERTAKLLRCAQKLEGLARHASTHAAGVIIAPGRLRDYVPLYRSAKGEITTQYDMKSVEKIGLLKMDFLGLRTLTVIEKAVQLVKENRGEEVELNRIPLDDPKTFDLLREGRTVGVFQLESGGMRDLLKRVAPETFGDIVALNALYRPGPLGSHMVDDFVERRHGRKKTRYDHPLLEPILKETYGVIVYQEQVMQIANQMADFSLAQADILRKAMGKKNVEEMDAQRAAFLKGAEAKKISHRIAKKVFDLMSHFAGYGFPKSHSAAYSLVSMRTAYLKAHYPVEFMAASLSSEQGNSERIAVLIEECREMGIGILPPDVNKSRGDFTVEGDKIRFGLAAIKNVGTGAIESIVRGRTEGGPYGDLYQLCARCDLKAVNKRVLESLVCSGACDSLSGSRAQKFSAIQDACEAAQAKVSKFAQATLFASEELGGNGKGGLPDLPEWPYQEQLSREKEALGFYLSDHPLSPFRSAIDALNALSTAAARELSDSEPVRIAGIVSAISRKSDRKGQRMAFVTLEDFVGRIEVIVFSELYSRVAELLEKESLVVLEGAVSRKEDEVKIVASDVKGLAESESAGSILVRVPLRLADPATLDELRAVAERFPGEGDLILVVKRGEEDVRVRSRAVKVHASQGLAEAIEKVLGKGTVEIVPEAAQPAGETGDRGGR